MNTLVKGSLAVGGGLIALEGMRRIFRVQPKPRYEPWERKPYREFENRVLVLGGGFGGYNAAKKLCSMVDGRDDVGVMLISKENYFTFWPMLAGVISSDIQTQNVAQPLRRSLIEAGASFRRATVEDIDFEEQVVTAVGEGEEKIEVPYDHLIMALGGEPAYFGIPGVEEHALSMTGIHTAEDIRNRTIERFEETTLARGEVPRSKLTFVIIGGGATGVETAAELHGLVHDVLAPDYPNINPKSHPHRFGGPERTGLEGTGPGAPAHGPQKVGRPGHRGFQQHQGAGDHRGQGDPGHRPRDRGRERRVDRRRPGEREAGRLRGATLRRAQGPRSGRISAA